ncbi:TetR/AcrR family transcriptional regulator [Bifidobacterium sp. ESL0690]|uniref:TetR/AcrR family transcriptional regulator n=1 Tax=Bifidobacterium sp. ESL0690 TaxID=2983214 RepID=UPI0023F79EB7|nr:TetR/AcrR family transcriptional regulator [Bifidobacterium sp. ESL0690]WEV47665.1 TetR/AcrR family transcriptional regulator [Bifidobacterium sp. ESL0690]
MARSSTDSEQRLLMETVKAIEKHGYRNISLRDIASAAGLTTGSLYRHFSTKEDLLVRAGYLVSENLAKLVLADEEEHPNAFDKLLRIGIKLLSLTQSNPNLVDFFFYGPLYAKAAKEGYEDKPPMFLSKLNEIVAQACRQYPNAIDPNLLFTQVWSFIQGYSALVRHGIVAYDERSLRLTLQDFLGVSRH